MSSPKPSAQLVAFLKAREKLSLTAYKKFPSEPFTIGYGDTKNVTKGMKITLEEAEKRLDERLQEFTDGLNSLLKVPLKQNQYDALFSLCYNTGVQALKESKALEALNRGDIEAFLVEAYDQDKGFVHSGGVKVKGLVKRRQMEKDIFTSGIYAP